MNLLNRIIINTAVSLTIIIALWMGCTYYISIQEIYDEIDDTLESYADRFLEHAWHTLPEDQMIVSASAGNGIYIEQVNEEYGINNTERRFYNREIYLDDIREDQDSRVISFTYKNRNNGQWYEITIFSPSFDQEDFRVILMNSSIILGLALILTIVGIITYILFKSMKPLYDILDKLKKHKPGQDIDFGEPRGEINEFRKIREAITASITRYNDAYTQQKIFIGNASHEIQTPIAVCQNTLEMLVEDPDIKPGQIELLARIGDRLSYISKLNKTLLLLTKLENNQYNDTEDVDISAIACNAANDMADLYDSKGISLDIKCGDSPLIFKMNLTLAKSMISNLVKNAYVHTGEGGHISIYWDNKSISICNSASQRLDTSKIFVYFYKGDDSPASSTGLGLPMAAAICKRYGYMIEYNYKNGMNIFRIFRNNSVSGGNFVS